MKLGFREGQSTAEVPDIRQREDFMTEDGLVGRVPKDDASALEEFYSQNIGKNYYDNQIERLRILEENPDYRWVTLLAGAMGRAAHELYEEDDLDRKLLEKEANKLRMKLEYERMVLPVEKKKQQLQFLREEREALRAELSQKEVDTVFVELNENGEQLINDEPHSIREPRRGIAEIYTMMFDITMIRLDFKPGNKDDYLFLEEREVKQRVIRERINEVLCLEKSTKLSSEEEHSLFSYLTLFRYLLDASPQSDHVYYLLNTLSANMTKVIASIAPTIDDIPFDVRT
jgi:hypothetical protein